MSGLPALLLLALIWPAQDKTASEVAEKLVNGFVNWNQSLNSAGGKVEFREVARGKKEGAPIALYDVIVTGVPHNQSYALYYWPVTVKEPQPVAAEVWLSEPGFVCASQENCDLLVRLNFHSAKGEPHRVMLISKDGKYHVVGVVIPDPINATDRGCNVEVVRLSPKFEIALVRGKGFKPNEKVKFTSNSAGERVEGVADVQDDGTFRLVLLPFVVGKDTGTDEVKFKGSNCSPVISYKWGTTEE